MGKIRISWEENSLMPLPSKLKTFHWNEQEWDYSEDALRLIELLMMGNISFRVETSVTAEIHIRRGEIVFGELTKQLGSRSMDEVKQQVEG